MLKLNDMDRLCKWPPGLSTNDRKSYSSPLRVVELEGELDMFARISLQGSWLTEHYSTAVLVQNGFKILFCLLQNTSSTIEANKQKNPA